MASISPLSFLSTINVSAANASSSLFPSSQKPLKSTDPKRRHAAKVACNANQNNLPTKPEEQPPYNNIIQGNRRDVLVGLGAATFAYNPFATAAPVAPDLSTCGLPNLPPGAKPTRCCPPSSTKVIDFVFPTNPSLRVRQPAHKLSADSITKYKQAIKLMKALPADDPRSFTQQANIHCAYCHYSYHQKGFPTSDIQVHNSWIFQPFHRWYLYFFERILGSLIKDPTFALPFWNWDHPDGMEMPAIFTDTRSPLYDSLRNANHQPPTLIDLNWNKRDIDTSGDVDTNLKKLYRQIYQVKSPLCFFGRPFRAGDSSAKTGSGTIELVHNVAHSWSGDPTQPNTEDMGSLYSSGRDPLFYCHHSNVDRMWSLWKSFGNKDIDDPDYLDSSFLFYDENKNLVSVKIRDSLDTKKLGYDYEQVDLPWTKDTAKPTPRSTKAETEAKPSEAQPVPLPFTLDGKNPVTTVVNLPKGGDDLCLLFSIEFDRTTAVKFDVCIDDDVDASVNCTPKDAEFAGSFVNVPQSQEPGIKTSETTFALPLAELLKDLKLANNKSFPVTLIPQYGAAGVIIKDITVGA